MNRLNSSVAAWAALAGLVVVGIGLANWSNASLNAAPAAAADGLAIDSSLNAGEWKGVALAAEVSSINTEGNFLVDFGGNPPVTRSVARLKAKVGNGTQRSEYSIRATANRSNASGPFSFKRLVRPPAPGAPAPIGMERAVSLDEASGEIVVSGTAPLIAVKKATVASDGTIFAIEADANGWWLIILQVTENHPVRVWYPQAGTRSAEFKEAKCWRFAHDTTDPSTAILVNDAGVSAALKSYAQAIFDQTQ